MNFAPQQITIVHFNKKVMEPANRLPTIKHAKSLFRSIQGII